MDEISDLSAKSDISAQSDASAQPDASAQSDASAKSDVSTNSDIAANADVPQSAPSPDLMQKIERLRLENMELKREREKMENENRALKVQRDDLIQNEIITQNDDNGDNAQTESVSNQISVVSNGSDPKYWFLYGHCPLTNGMWRYHLIIMDDLKRRMSIEFPHWIMVNVSIAEWLDNLGSNYTHSDLLSFTQSVVPSLSMSEDRWQWIFEPQCEKYFNLGRQWMMKRYYRDHKEETNLQQIQMPRTFKQWMNETLSVNIIDDSGLKVASFSKMFVKFLKFKWKS